MPIQPSHFSKVSILILTGAIYSFERQLHAFSISDECNSSRDFSPPLLSPMVVPAHPAGLHHMGMPRHDPPPNFPCSYGDAVSPYCSYSSSYPVSNGYVSNSYRTRPPVAPYARPPEFVPYAAYHPRLKGLYPRSSHVPYNQQPTT